MKNGFNKDETGRNPGRRSLQNPRQEFMRACTKVMMTRIGRREWSQGIFRAISWGQGDYHWLAGVTRKILEWLPGFQPEGTRWWAEPLTRIQEGMQLSERKMMVQCRTWCKSRLFRKPTSNYLRCPHRFIRSDDGKVGVAKTSRLNSRTIRTDFLSSLVSLSLFMLSLLHPASNCTEGSFSQSTLRGKGRFCQ